ncbi:DUF2235 domain-containing protein [Sphingomonas morindae]|uniref:DUF2235 domain-containing protein n=1 Tax=Sphingomonas morindae TaxID=1541170 RepID=A0ABY4XCU9_9SPHN|nr:DUF2235 domain-containing protein [Sphingomonas morindae]USI74738.1 DUF2235 domain-containing protein [Sphingomonas morindae]
MKRLVVCFDGTWNNADVGGADTNVVRLARSIHATTGTGGVLQSVLYLRGVGTTGLRAGEIVEGGTGLGVDDAIRSAYMFLAQNYLPGDELFLFGFSRGAFSARSLVGLIAAAGLLKRQALGFLGAAWRHYRTPPPRGPADFLRANPGAATHQAVPVQFLGVWDTVGALGFPGSLFAPVNRRLYGFHDTSACPIVRRAAHALAIDEHRGAFVPTFWTGRALPGQSIDQTWFAGAHADVGGGYGDRALADIPLLWMATRAAAAGLVLDPACLPSPATLDPHAPQHQSSRGSFAYSRLAPVYRRVCERGVALGFGRRLYVPRDPDGQTLPTVNEAIHASVVARWGAAVATLTREAGPAPPRRRYAPPTLAPLLADAGAALPPVDRTAWPS